MSPQNKVSDFKRLIDLIVSYPSVRDDMKSWPFKVFSNAGDEPDRGHIKGDEKKFSVKDISSMALTKKREEAETLFGYPVKNVVVIVPAYFNHLQRHAMSGDFWFECVAKISMNSLMV